MVLRRLVTTTDTVAGTSHGPLPMLHETKYSANSPMPATIVTRRNQAVRSCAILEGTLTSKPHRSAIVLTSAVPLKRPPCRSW